MAARHLKTGTEVAPSPRSRLRRVAPSLLTGFVAVLGLVVGGAIRGTPGDEPWPETDVGPLVVGVRAAGCSLVDQIATGVIVEDGGSYIVTVAHAVAGAQSITVVDALGDEEPATLVGLDPNRDLAVLRVGALGRSGAPLGDLDVGDRSIVVTWHPDEGFNHTSALVSRRMRVSIEDIYLEEIVERGALEIKTPVARGDSGAPVFNQQGEVAGIVYARSRDREGVGFAVSASEIAAVLSRLDGSTLPPGRCP